MAFNWQNMGQYGLLGGLMGGGDDAYDEANKYISQIPGRTAQYFNPYIGAGRDAIPYLQQQYAGLTSDPGGFVNRIGAGYKESPGFQFALKKALAGGNRAFAAGGMGGSPASANWGMETAQGLASQDYNQYLQHALQQYGLGLEGERGLFQGGLQAGTNQAQMIAQALAQQGNLKFGQAASQQAQTGNMFNAGMQMLPFLMG